MLHRLHRLQPLYAPLSRCLRPGPAPRSPRYLSSRMSFQYPQCFRDEAVVDDYHGHRIPDPYSWLEDPDSEKTQAFVAAQNQLTVPFLEQCEVRELFKERMTELYDYPKYSCPFKRGSR
uniref:Peptidase S9A N-terminal domain-containing protein n=1 Tax=Knipowitschia caucasica TaxID=637954 RepID=A0AAV2KF24_KNICA